MLGLACLILCRGLERGRQESPGLPGTVMHGFSEQRHNNSQLLCSCAPSTTWEPLCSVAWTSEFHPAWCQGELVNLFQTPCLCCYLISLDLLVDPRSGFHWWDGGPESGMSAVGRGVRERGCHWERWAFSPKDMLACLSKGAFHKAKGKKWL